MARREPVRESQGPDTEPGCFAVEPLAGVRSSETKQTGPVHGIDASYRCCRAGASIPSIEAEGERGSRWGDCRNLRAESGGQPQGSLRTGAYRTLPATTG